MWRTASTLSKDIGGSIPCRGGGRSIRDLSRVPTIETMGHAPPPPTLLRAKALADARYFEPLDVGDMARAAGLSRAHFSREFRRAVGAPPPAYLLPPPLRGGA